MSNYDYTTRNQQSVLLARQEDCILTTVKMTRAVSHCIHVVISLSNVNKPIYLVRFVLSCLRLVMSVCRLIIPTYSRCLVYNLGVSKQYCLGTCCDWSLRLSLFLVFSIIWSDHLYTYYIVSHSNHISWLVRLSVVNSLPVSITILPLSRLCGTLIRCSTVPLLTVSLSLLTLSKALLSRWKLG